MRWSLSIYSDLFQSAKNSHQLKVKYFSLIYVVYEMIIILFNYIPIKSQTLKLVTCSYSQVGHICSLFMISSYKLLWVTKWMSRFSWNSLQKGLFNSYLLYLTLKNPEKENMLRIYAIDCMENLFKNAKLSGKASLMYLILSYKNNQGSMEWLSY